MLSTLSHPALARVYENFVEGQKQYLVMEYVEGKNLEDELIEEGRPLEWNRVVAWGMDLCDVLVVPAQSPAADHLPRPETGECDADAERQLKLIDFGIARWLHTNRSHDTAQLGTDGYAPLEQYSARSEPRSDLYALGASMYHLLTGRVPESAPARVGGQSLMPLRAINPQVPEAIERVIVRALSLQARERYRGREPDAGRADAASRGARGGKTGISPGAGRHHGLRAPRRGGASPGRGAPRGVGAATGKPAPLRWPLRWTPGCWSRRRCHAALDPR